MAFQDVRLDTAISYGFVGGPEFSTRIVPMNNGQENRNQTWVNPLHRYVISHEMFTRTNYLTLRAFFYGCAGQLNAFRFKDWADYQATAEALGNAPAGSAAVQLKKTYTNGSTSYVRTITKPVSGTVTVYQAGVAKTGTLDTSTGLFTPTTAWTEGEALTWTGEFDVPVRFASDHYPAKYEDYNALTAEIELVEVRL